jgi:hypothetical protein
LTLVVLFSTGNASLCGGDGYGIKHGLESLGGWKVDNRSTTTKQNMILCRCNDGPGEPLVNAGMDVIEAADDLFDHQRDNVLKVADPP